LSARTTEGMSDPRFTARMVAAMEANFHAFLPRFGCQGESVLHDEPDASWFVTPVDSTLFNQVMRARFRAASADRRIRELCDAYREYRVPFLWWVTPDSSPPDLGSRLEAAGLLLQERWQGMWAPLDAIPRQEAPPSGCCVREVESAGQLDDWLEVFAENFQVTASLETRFHAVWSTQLGGEGERLRPFLATWQGVPAATALLFEAAGVAGLYCVSTVPALRRRGIGRAVALAALVAGARGGFPTAVLQATPAGLSIYEALGFRTCCRFSYYYGDGEWDAEAFGSC